ncbi:MAG: hypothetical protein AB7U83_24080, partial [Vicinamibacterales bacterium]
MRPRTPGSILVIVLLVTAPALAQDRLFWNGEEFGAHGRFGEHLGPALGRDLPLAGGGRFAVTDSDVVDLRTGARRPLPAGARLVAPDRARPTLVVELPGTGRAGTLDLAAFDIVTGAVSPLLDDVCQRLIFGIPAGGARAVYADDAQTAVAQQCDGLGVVRDLVVVDVAGRAPLRVLPIVAGVEVMLTLSPDGTRLYVAHSSPASSIEAYDVGTGRLVGTADAGGADFIRQLTWHDALDILTVEGDFGPFDPRLLSAFGPNLEPLGSVWLESRICNVTVQASPHTGRLYVTTNGSRRTLARPLRLEVFEGRPPRSVGVALPPDVGGAETCNGVVVRSAPGVPRDVRATGAGGEGLLVWR